MTPYWAWNFFSWRHFNSIYFKFDWRSSNKSMMDSFTMWLITMLAIWFFYAVLCQIFKSIDNNTLLLLSVFKIAQEESYYFLKNFNAEHFLVHSVSDCSWSSMEEWAEKFSLEEGDEDSEIPYRKNKTSLSTNYIYELV